MTPRQFVPAPNRNKRFRVVAIGILLALMLAVPVIRRGMRTSLNAVGTTVAKGTHGVGGWLASIGTNFRSKAALESENTAQKREIDELGTRLAERDTLARENAELKASLGRSDGERFTLAAVISKPPHSVYDTLIIDGGSAAALALGQVVYANGEIPIGAIAEIFPHSAVVKLYSAPGEQTEARLSPSNVDITLVGRGGGNFSVMVPHDLPVAAGAAVLTKEIRPRIIALYKKTTSDMRDPFQTLLLAAPINVNELSFVEVRQ